MLALLLATSLAPAPLPPGAITVEGRTGAVLGTWDTSIVVEPADLTFMDGLRRRRLHLYGAAGQVCAEIHGGRHDVAVAGSPLGCVGGGAAPGGTSNGVLTGERYAVHVTLHSAAEVR